MIHWTYESLTRNDRLILKQLPTEIKIEDPNLGLIQAVHASTAGDRIGIYPDTPDSHLPGLIAEDAKVFLIGHTHQPLIRNFQETMILNIGSIGLPFDGDRRAAYAQIESKNGTWKGKITRVPYDLETAEVDFHQTGFIPEGGLIANLVLKELQLGWPQLGKFFRKYASAIRENRTSLEDAVYEYLKNPNIESNKTNCHGKIIP